jgi:RimJ/RimL family protein N-acetyltransferase
MTGSLHKVEGVRLSLRSVTTADAEFIHSLRMNESYNTHISRVTGTVNDQRDWITSYKKREAKGLEYYYIIERLQDHVPCGVVRLYDIQETSFTWGSWILDHNKPSKAALESAVLVYEAGFSYLKKLVSIFDVRCDNERTLAFHRRFGAQQTSEDGINVYFDYTSAQFEQDRPHHMKHLTETGAK